MLINCVAYQDGKRLRNIDVEDISDYVQRPDGFVWVALRDPEPAELNKMQEEFSLHDLAVEDAHHGYQRPKVEEYGDSLFVVIHTVEVVEDDLLVGELAIFVEKNYVLSVRNRSQQDFLGVRARCEREPDQLKQGPAFVLYALMDAVVDRYFPVIQTLELELEAIEESIFSDQARKDDIARLYALKRKIMQLKHAAAPMMDAMAKLYGGRVPHLCTNTQEYFRDVHDHLNRIDTSINAIRDTINTAIQVSLSMVAIEGNDVSKQLASWAAIFAAATLFVGIWGMNFKHMPELDWRYGYPLALGIVGGVCGYLYFRFKKAGWL